MTTPPSSEEDEAYEIGKRDGISEATQHIDCQTGGDGEYRYCLGGDPDRHCPDPATMQRNIVERFDAQASRLTELEALRARFADIMSRTEEAGFSPQIEQELMDLAEALSQLKQVEP